MKEWTFGDVNCSITRKGMQNVQKPLLNRKGKEVVAMVDEDYKMKFPIMRATEPKQLIAQDPVFCSSLHAQKANSSFFVELFYHFRDTTLTVLLAVLFTHCNFSGPFVGGSCLNNGEKPLWWPTMKEKWWIELGFPTHKGEPLFGKPEDLPKSWKLAVLASIVYYQSPKTICKIVKWSVDLKDEMNLKEKFILSVALNILASL